jgi:hypothetical protein
MAALWLDTSTIGDVAAGNQDLEGVVKSMGDPLLITPKVKEELLDGNFLAKEGKQLAPATASALAQMALTRLSVQVDTMGDAEVRRALFEKQFKFKPGVKAEPGRTVIRSIEESDAIILSQVAASGSARGIVQPARLLVTDQRLFNAPDAKLWNNPNEAARVVVIMPDENRIKDRRDARERVTNSLRDLLATVRRQNDQFSGEHKMQSDLITSNPSVTNIIGIAGFWTNHLFNKDVPSLTIWNPSFGSALRSERLLHEGKLPEAYAAALQARAELMRAIAIYLRWKDGIQGAGTRMQIAIGAVAVAAVLAVLGGWVVAAEQAPSELAGLTRAVNTVNNAALRVAVSDAPQAAEQLELLEEAQEEAQEQISLILRM